MDEAKHRLSASMLANSEVDNIETRENSKGQSRSSEKQMRTSNVSVSTKVVKITIGYFSETGDGSLDQNKLMAVFDEEEGFTVVGRL